MTEIDPITREALGQLRREWSPPSGIEERMLADFHLRFPDPGGGGGGEGSDLPAPELGSVASSVGGTASAAWVHAVKIVAAVAGLTSAGLGGVVVVAKVAREPAPVVDHSEAPVAEVIAVRSPIQPAIEPDPAAESPDPVVGEPEPQTPLPRTSAVAVRKPAPASVDLSAELALLRPARSAKPIDALELLDRHADRFPAGALASEREALRAATLCGLGRLDQASAAIDRLLALDPGPLLRERVRSACDGKLALPTTGFGGSGDGSP